MPSIPDRYASASPPPSHQGTVSSSGDNDTCTICLDAFSSNLKEETTQCDHRFHSECLEAWTDAVLNFGGEPECPNCRGSLSARTDAAAAAALPPALADTEDLLRGLHCIFAVDISMLAGDLGDEFLQEITRISREIFSSAADSELDLITVGREIATHRGITTAESVEGLLLLASRDPVPPSNVDMKPAIEEIVRHYQELGDVPVRGMTAVVFTNTSPTVLCNELQNADSMTENLWFSFIHNEQQRRDDTRASLQRLDESLHPELNLLLDTFTPRHEDRWDTVRRALENLMREMEATVAIDGGGIEVFFSS